MCFKKSIFDHYRSMFSSREEIQRQRTYVETLMREMGLAQTTLAKKAGVPHSLNHELVALLASLWLQILAANDNNEPPEEGALDG